MYSEYFSQCALYADGSELVESAFFIIDRGALQMRLAGGAEAYLTDDTHSAGGFAANMA